MWEGLLYKRGRWYGSRIIVFEAEGKGQAARAAADCS